MRTALLLTLLAFFSAAASAQQVLMDINAVGVSSHPRRFLESEGRVFFEVRTGRHVWVSDAQGTRPTVRLDTGGHGLLDVLSGRALVVTNPDRDDRFWTTDGTTAKLLLEDHLVGGGGRTPGGVAMFMRNRGLVVTDLESVTTLSPAWRGRMAAALETDSLLYLTLHVAPGVQLWQTDGTVSRTHRLETGDISVVRVHAAGGRIYFTGARQDTGSELWRLGLDGEPPERVTQLEMDNVRIDGLQASGDKLFFGVVDQDDFSQYLYVTDGTAPGTRLLLESGPDLTIQQQDLNPAPNGVLFQTATNGHGFEPWYSDGTAAGTGMLVDLNPGPLHSHPRFLAASDGVSYLAGTGADGRRRLPRTDGTPAGTAPLITSGVEPDIPIDVWSATLTESRLLFPGRTPEHGTEPWMVDLDTGRAQLLVDAEPGATTESSDPAGLMTWQNRVYFSANDGMHGFALWETDGFESRTSPVSRPFAPYRPEQTTTWNESLLFTEYETGIWRLDGPGQTARLILHRNVSDLAAIDDRLLFFAGERSELVLYSWSGEPEAFPARVPRAFGAGGASIDVSSG